MKEWMRGPFLSPSDINSVVPKTITLFPELFEKLFAPEDRYDAFYVYYSYFHDSTLSYNDVEFLLENFKKHPYSGEWYSQDEVDEMGGF